MSANWTDTHGVKIFMFHNPRESEKSAFDRVQFLIDHVADQ